jgi:hypothetical protein
VVTFTHFLDPRPTALCVQGKDIPYGQDIYYHNLLDPWKDAYHKSNLTSNRWVHITAIEWDVAVVGKSVRRVVCVVWYRSWSYAALISHGVVVLLFILTCECQSSLDYTAVIC